MVKRGKLEIIRDILQAIANHRNFIKPTPLLRKSNLSSVRFNEYYVLLISKGIIREVGEKEKHIILTEKGFRFLEKYKAIVDFIDEFEL